jgi:hypothetical protein
MRFRVFPSFLVGLVFAAQVVTALPAESPESVSDAPSPAVASPAPSSEKNKLTYVGVQTLLTTYVYGLAFPLAYGADNPRVLIAAPLITAPLAFGAHLWISRQLDFTDAHLKGTSYVPTLATYAATALPLAFTNDFGNGYKTGAILGAIVYPLGLWYGYHLGDVYRSNPGQLDAKFKFALGYGFLGFITPALYFERPGDHSEDILRVGLGQSAGFAALGFAVADFYRTGPEVPSGVPLGISTHTLLGGLAGIEFAALADASSARPWIGAAVLGSSLGFTEGVLFFYPSHDSQERSLYSLLGGLGGALMGAGLQLLLYDKQASSSAQKAEWSSYLIGGTWLGYWTTYLLTMGMVEEPRKHAGVDGNEKATPIRWALNPLPAMEPVMSRGDMSWRWRVPGVSYRF